MQPTRREMLRVGVSGLGVISLGGTVPALVSKMAFAESGAGARAADHVLRGTEGLLKAVNIGPELPQALVADHEVVPSIQSIDDFRIRTDPNTGFDARLEEQIIRRLNAVKDSSPAVQYLSRQATDAII